MFRSSLYTGRRYNASLRHSKTPAFRSLAPAVMVRIHPGQLCWFSVRLRTLMAVAYACGTPLGLWAAPAPSTLPAPRGSAVLQAQAGQWSADSTRIRSQAEDAQGRFERIRGQLLPYAWEEGRRPCEERIGRLCLWYDGEDDWEPVPDPPDLVGARDELLTTLAGAADRIPGDEWIVGQRIRYLGEAGRWEDAVRLARTCGAAVSSWCSVLEGFALHGMGRYEAALGSFRRGLETMDPEEARKWWDPTVLLDGKGSDILEDAAEATDEREWEAARARVWALADPLYLVAGNDRESEHYARWTYSKMSDDARNAWAMRWGDDLEEVAVRYGWDRGWERIRSTFGAVGGLPNVIGHQLPGGKEFMPPGQVLESPSSTASGVWVPEEKRPRSTHVPAYAPTLLPGVVQVALFQRGDSMVVAAATELPANPDTVPKGPLPAGSSFPWPQPALLDGPEQIGLFLVDEAGRIKRTSSSLSEGIVHIVVPTGKYLLSVEAWAPEKGLGGRIRQGITTEALPDDVATLSDLILLHSPHGGDTLPQTLASALSSMRSSTRLEATRQLALGWEVFGLGWRQEDVAFELSFRKEGGSFFGRIGRWLGFGGGQEAPLQLEWSERGPSEIGPWFRSVEVTIPEVDPGKYVFRLEVTARGREELVRTRMVEIVP